ncbi:MAG: heat shock protein HspQ [Pseudomonadales bacterium]|nr:heat shock protein HspQ [Pseudomonadales bacterium]
MGTVTSIVRVNYSVGELVHHRLFNYRGVVIDVDQNFQSTDEWYEAVARSRPPKNKPWYHVLVHGSSQTTYVAEQNLEHDQSELPIEHPMLNLFFSKLDNGKYVRISPVN